MNEKHFISITAWVVLPDHFHLILSPKEKVLDRYIHDFKLSFGSIYRKSNNLNSGNLWQSRFWDHIIRNQNDMNTHIDYIHYNPVKHGYTDDPFKWEFSSINKFSKEGVYQPDWGNVEKLEHGFGEI